jgi:hypothetical protein
VDLKEEIVITGMLWFDNDKQTSLSSKIDRAAKYYSKKYGRTPEVCFVHPKMIESAPDKEKPARMEVKASHTILLHHFWIGIKENEFSKL